MTHPRSDRFCHALLRRVIRWRLGDREAEDLVSLYLGRRSESPFAGRTEIRYGRALLKCLRPIDPRDPLWVVRASDDVVHGHNGIFTTYLVDFVRQVIVEEGARTHP